VLGAGLWRVLLVECEEPSKFCHCKNTLEMLSVSDGAESGVPPGTHFDSNLRKFEIKGFTTKLKQNTILTKIK